MVRTEFAQVLHYLTSAVPPQGMGYREAELRRLAHRPTVIFDYSQLLWLTKVK